MGAAQTTSAHPLTIENLIDIKHPSNPLWSPDGKHVAFLWDRADIVNLYLANPDGGGGPMALTSFPDGKVTDVFWSKDGSTVYFLAGPICGRWRPMVEKRGQSGPRPLPRSSSRYLPTALDWRLSAPEALVKPSMAAT